MPVFRPLPAILLLLLLSVPAGAANEPDRRCLSEDSQRLAISAHQAIPLGDAIKAVQRTGHRAEVVRARLCRGDNGLVYVLTLLARNGKVTSATVNAANGALVNGP